MMTDPLIFFQWLDDLALLGEKLAPSINALIEDRIPADKQRVMIKRIKRVQRLCRHEHLPAAMIRSQVALLFNDLSADFQNTIATQIIFTLKAV